MPIVAPDVAKQCDYCKYWFHDGQHYEAHRREWPCPPLEIPWKLCNTMCRGTDWEHFVGCNRYYHKTCFVRHIPFCAEMAYEDANVPKIVELPPGIGNEDGDAEPARQCDSVEPESDLKLTVNQLHNQLWAQQVQLQYLLGTSTQGQGRTASPQGKGKGHTSNANFSGTDENRGARTKT